MTDVSNEPDQSWTILFVCWLLVASASLGSLFFSEIMQLPPCSLCWAQRIFMFGGGLLMIAPGWQMPAIGLVIGLADVAPSLLRKRAA